MFNSKVRESIGFIYDPKHEIVKTERFSKITFGIGDRKIPEFERRTSKSII